MTGTSSGSVISISITGTILQRPPNSTVSAGDAVVAPLAQNCAKVAWFSPLPSVRLRPVEFLVVDHHPLDRGVGAGAHALLTRAHEPHTRNRSWYHQFMYGDHGRRGARRDSKRRRSTHDSVRGRVHQVW